LKGKDMDWKNIFQNSGYEGVLFFDPITENELEDIYKNIGIEISGDLLELLRQTNGIMETMILNNVSEDVGWIIYSSKKIIENNKIHLDFLREAECTPPYQLIFFSDNGCGESFGFITKDGKIVSDEIGIYYPISNEFKILASNLKTWAKSWCSGEIKT
jgi:hypothetical protein